MQVKAIGIMRLATTVLFMAAWHSTARAESVYQLNASTTEGVDLTAMEGYYADRMEGPSSDNITFSGPLVVDPSISASNPFRLIGQGKQITVDVAGSGFHSVPLKLYNADGVTGASTLKFNAGATYSGGTLDIGRYNKVTHGYYSNGNYVYTCGTFNIHDGGKIDDSYAIALGLNTAVNVSVTGDALIKGGWGLILGKQDADMDTPMTAFMGITNATVTAGGTTPLSGKVFSLMLNVANSTGSENCRVVIGPGGKVNANMISHHGHGSSRIIFDGGKYISNTDTEEAKALSLFHVYGYSYKKAWANPVMNVEGINGNPIDIEIAFDRILASVQGGTPTASRKINLTGTGGFTKRGAGTLYFKPLYQSGSTCDYTGPTTILGGGIVVSNAAYKVGRGELALSEGTFLDLNGFDVEFCGATGAGIVTNRAETTSSLTLGYGNADSSFTTAVGERISIVKTGTGTLTVSGAALANACDLTIEGGKVVFAGDSSSYGTVTVMADGILDITGVEFSCQSLVKRGGKVLPPPGICVIIF